MSVMPIGSLPAVLPTAPVSTSAPAESTRSAFASGLEQVQGSLDHADALGQQLASGELTDLHEYMAASTKASLAVELTVAIRDKAVEAYQEIMRMQI
jgi:flagellar hook-basal body complex protein FliE